MKSINLIYTLILTFSFLFISCNDDDLQVDSQKPFIEIHSPEDETHYLPENEIELRAYFSDNLELKSYKIDIHYGGDGHHHRGAINSQEDEHNHAEGAQWEYNQSYEIETALKEYNLIEKIKIPVEINQKSIQEGAYHLGIFLLDKAGNEQVAFVEIHIGKHDNHESKVN